MAKDKNFLLGYKMVVCLGCKTFRNGNTEKCPVCDRIFHTPVHDGYIHFQEFITEDEIRQIDHRIQWIIVDNPTFDFQEYCCQVGFIFKFKAGKEIRPNGKLNFVANTKGELINKIETFFSNKERKFDILSLEELQQEENYVT